MPVSAAVETAGAAGHVGLSSQHAAPSDRHVASSGHPAAPSAQSVALSVKHGGSQKHVASAVSHARAHSVVRHTGGVKARGTFSSAAIVVHRTIPGHHHRAHAAATSRAGGTLAVRPTVHFSTGISTARHAQAVKTGRQHRGNVETYRVGASYYHVQYVKGTRPYAIIQHLPTRSDTPAQGVLTTVSGYPATLLAAIGHALAGLARTGGGGVGAVASLPFPVQTILFGLLLAGLGVLLRGFSFAMRPSIEAGLGVSQQPGEMTAELSAE